MVRTVAATALLALHAAVAQAQGLDRALLDSMRARDPQDAAVLFQLAVQAAAAGRSREALDLLDAVSRAPGALDPGFHRGFFQYHGDTTFQRILAAIRTANPPIVRSTPAFTIAERDLHPEGIAFDPVTRASFLGSFKGKIVRIDSAGRASDFAFVSRPEAPRVVVGLRVDAERRHLWAVVDDPRAFGDASIEGGALMQFDIATGRVIAAHRGAKGAFNDLVVAPDGTVYTTNPVDGSIWRVAIDGRLEIFLPPGSVPASNGIAISPDGRWLIVAGWHDLVRVDVATRALLPLAAPPRTVLGSFDGIYWYGDGLVGIQNGVHPGRVVQLTLDPAISRVTRATVLEQYHPRFGGMTTAALDGHSLLYIVNTQSRSFNPDGSVKAGVTLEEVLVARVPLTPLGQRSGDPASSQPSPEQSEWIGAWARLKEYTLTKYANFDWKVRHDVDPVALHARTDSLLRRATSTGQARAALVAFVDAFRDGHFSARAIPSNAGDANGIDWPPRNAPTRALCRSFGYRAEGSRSAFARLRGWRPVDLPRLPFAAGVVERDGARVAVLRIHSFGYEPHAWACEAAWPQVKAQLQDEATMCEAHCERLLRRAIADTLAAALAEAVRTLAREQPSALVIDLMGNGGGTEWVSKAVRAITARPIPAQPVAFIRNDFHRTQLERTLARVDSALPSVPPGPWRDTLTVAQARLTAAVRLARTPCDRSSVWRDGPAALTCDGLITGLWTAGSVPLVPPGLAPRDELTLEINSLAHSATVNAGWSGPLVLVVDRASASATEQFVAELADGADAWVVGERTYGSGCGFTRGAERLDLPEVGLRVRAPDCARIRPDGTNEVAGIAPTRDAGWRRDDGATVRAEKVIALLLRG